MDETEPQGRFRLVALDIDGTVLNSAGEVCAALKRTLAALARRSVRTVLCTGRRMRSAVPVLAELEHVHPILVCSGGALVKRVDDEETLYTDPLGDALAQRAAEVYRRAGLMPIVLYDHPLSGRELWVAAADRRKAEGLAYVQLNRDAVEYFEGDWPEGLEAPLEVYTVDRTERVEAARDRVRRDLEGSAIVEAMFQPRYGELALEVRSPTATKWAALQYLLDRWGIPPAQVVAVGDDVNDLPMLEAAGLSFAMGNALPEVKETADEVTATNDEEGVARALALAFPGGQ
ncbi:MAG: HAD-IIB family hydrolase [Candidatus Brocadiia bacterium]